MRTSVHTTIFDVPESAKAGTTMGDPLTIKFAGGTEVAVFTRDAALTADLADAINAVLAKHGFKEAA